MADGWDLHFFQASPTRVIRVFLKGDALGGTIRAATFLALFDRGLVTLIRPTAYRITDAGREALKDVAL
jgi:hypothetical protein